MSTGPAPARPAAEAADQGVCGRRGPQGVTSAVIHVNQFVCVKSGHVTAGKGLQVVGSWPDRDLT
jgi:hypothetical protein